MVGKSARIFVQGFILCTLIAIPTLSRAWESPINLYLVELADLGRAPGIQQHADEFKNGADDPLRQRKARPWEMPPDLDTATSLAEAAFRAAFGSRDQSGAARSLGQACYYLQDLADPSHRLKSLHNTPHEEELRRMAERLAAQLISEQQAGSKRSTFWDLVEAKQQQLEGADWVDLVETARSSAKESAANIIRSLRRADPVNGPDNQTGIYGYLAHTFADIVACQNRLLSLYQQRRSLPLPEPENRESGQREGTVRIRIAVWDAPCEDGDRIDLRVNGVLRLHDHALTRKKKVLHLDLPRKSMLPEIRALSSGSDCPPKPKPQTHASVAVSITGDGLDLQKSWLIREGGQKNPKRTAEDQTF